MIKVCISKVTPIDRGWINKIKVNLSRVEIVIKIVNVIQGVV